MASNRRSVPDYGRRRKALEIARRSWEYEDWGEPKDAAQERLWCLFFTNYEPDAEISYHNWNRPHQWVEDLVRA